MDLLEELLITLMYSRRALLAIVFGVLFFFGILMLGHHLANNLRFNGPFAPLADAIRPIILIRYEHVAWGALISFWMLAGKILLKERKRLF
ncbi:MAG: hypothetical protein SFU55_11730 [Methylophilus sp.]|nr:hypothetical protein [Methylophilus sp.]